MRGKYEEATIPPWIIRFNLADSVDALHSEDTRGRRTRTHKHTRRVCVTSAWSGHQTQDHRRVNVCTPTSLALVRASCRATTNNDRGEREEDGGKDVVREHEEGERV